MPCHDCTKCQELFGGGLRKLAKEPIQRVEVHDMATAPDRSAVSCLISDLGSGSVYGELGISGQLLARLEEFVSTFTQTVVHE